MEKHVKKCAVAVKTKTREGPVKMTVKKMLKENQNARKRKSKRRKHIKEEKKTRKRTAKKKSALTLVKAKENPLISPEESNKWECWQTFNPGVVLLGKKFHFLYRAVGEDGISRFGYANSKGGFCVDERLPHPVYEHPIKQCCFNVYSYFSGGSFGGAEDPRIVRVDKEDVLYVTYTACDNGLRVALTSITVDDFLNKKWNWKPAMMISPPGQVHKNWVIFPEKINGKYAVLHSISPKILVSYFDSLEFDDSTHINSTHDGMPMGDWKKGWEGWIRAVGPPPIKTKYGWLVFYHAMHKSDFSKYKLGAMLLDLKKPTKILHRSRKPVLEPSHSYETHGYKPGVVYASGAVVKDGTLLLYYGGADSCVCVACAKLDKFLESLIKGIKPRLVKKVLKKRE